MKRYNRVIGGFLKKADKLIAIAEKDAQKVEKLVAKAARIKAQIDAKICRLQAKSNEAQQEAEKCNATAEKLKDLFE
jgi:hypothetical protein